MMRGAKKHALAQRDPEHHVRTCDSIEVFVYILPCRHEDILKVGFSRDPLGRMHTLHARYFEFFDMDRALLVGTESVREARRLERELFEAAELHSAPAPLLIRAAAGGHTEWYRGAYSLLWESARDKAAAAGFAVHLPLRPWLREQMRRRAEGLYESTTHMLRAIESARAYGMAATTLETGLRDLLESFAAADLDIGRHTPVEVLGWYQRNRGRCE